MFSLQPNHIIKKTFTPVEDVLNGITKSFAKEAVPSLTLGGINLINNPVHNPSILLKTIDKMSDEEVYNTLNSSYKSIINSIQYDSNSNLLRLFTNLKFVRAFSQVINATSSSLTEEEVVICNSLAYDYLTAANQNDEIKTELLNMVSKINSSSICVLMGLNIPKNIATYIALSRKSSYDEVTNIKRMNFVIITSEYKEMGAQMIVHIYESLFDSLCMLFYTTMINPIPEDETQEKWITESVIRIDSEINIALLTLLEAMPLNGIYNVIKYYVLSDVFNNNTKPKFSLKAIAVGDYPRITSVIEKLNMQNIYVP